MNQIEEDEILLNLGLNPNKIRLDDLSEADLNDLYNNLSNEDF